MSKITIKLMIKAILMTMCHLLSLKNLSKNEESPPQISKSMIIKSSNKKFFKNKNNQKPNKMNKTMTFWTTKNSEKSSKKLLESKMIKNSLILSSKWKFKAWKWNNSKSFLNQRMLIWSLKMLSKLKKTRSKRKKRKKRKRNRKNNKKKKMRKQWNFKECC